MRTYQTSLSLFLMLAACSLGCAEDPASKRGEEYEESEVESDDEAATEADQVALPTDGGVSAPVVPFTPPPVSYSRSR